MTLTETQRVRKENFDKIITHLSNGGAVMIYTHLKATIYKPKHSSMFKFSNGSIYVQHGKRWDCMDYANVAFSK